MFAVQRKIGRRMVETFRIPPIGLMTTRAICLSSLFKLLSMDICMASRTLGRKTGELLHLIFHVATATIGRIMFSFERIFRLVMIKSNGFPIFCIVASGTRLVWIVIRRQESLMHVFVTTFTIQVHVTENPILSFFMAGKTWLRFMGTIDLEPTLFMVFQRK
jgi:hypothetical protein